VGIIHIASVNGGTKHIQKYGNAASHSLYGMA